MKTTILTTTAAILLLLIGCQKTEMTDMPEGSGQLTEEPDLNAAWLIPEKDILDGGPGKDGIPAINEPRFVNPNEINYMFDNDLVLGFADGDDIRAYPHPILDWHEIINDETENHSLAVIYCPLTGTGIGWDRIIDDNKTTFGVSGLLYNSNIIPYDRKTNSNWSQLLLKSVNGDLKGKAALTYNLLETSWKTWKKMYPNSKVVSSNTGYNRSYGNYPYGGYKVSKQLLFPISNTDNRIDLKQRVLGVIINH